MNFSLFVALRYLISKKSHGAINIISWITVVAVTAGSTALIIILSIFNGFDSLIQSMYNSIDPDLKITPKEGKIFIPDSTSLYKIKSINGVEFISQVVEEEGLLRYQENYHIATIKGVDENYINVSGVDSMLVDGKFVLEEGVYQNAVIGKAIGMILDIPRGTEIPMVIYIPKRSSSVSTISVAEEFNQRPVYINGRFSIDMNTDSKYAYVSIDLLRQLIKYTDETSALEIKLSPDADLDDIQDEIQNILGEGFEVKNRYQQNAIFFRVMKIEKWAIGFILSFIILIASFNILGTLTMLILDKKADIEILRSMGANNKQIKNIFLAEGTLISVLGCFIGLFIGGLFCWLQQTFGFIRIEGTGNFIIDAYPVQLQFLDFIAIICTVISIGLLASWYPVNQMNRKYLKRNK